MFGFGLVKKGLWVAAGGMLLALLIFGRDAASYVSTSASRVQDSVRDNVPIEFEIDRARKMVKDLVPDIQRNMHVIAKEEVEVERLQKEIARLGESQQAKRDEIMQLRADLTSDRDVYRYAGREYTNEQVKADLAHRFERYKTSDATVASLRDILAARERSLTAARNKLDEMLAAKRQLEVDVEHLEARLRTVEVAQTTSERTFDDSKLSRAKDLVGDIRSRLSVAEKLVHAENSYTGEIPVSTTTTGEVVDEVTEYFELQGADQRQLASHER